MFCSRAGWVVVALVLWGIPGWVGADVLVVTKRGESIPARTAKKEGETVVYVRRDDGVEVSVPSAELSGVLPMVSRGTAYETADIEKFIARIKGVRDRHPTLLKQINGILQEWENLLKPNPEMEGTLERLAAEFQAGDKSPALYRKLAVDLGMLGYKDMQGKYAARIKTILDAARVDCVAANRARITAMVDGARKDPDRFLEVHRQVEEVAAIAEEPERSEIKGQLESVRSDCLTQGLQTALAAFEGKRDLDGYLESARRLFVLRDVVAATDADRARVETLLKRLLKDVAAALPAYDFSFEGFPMGKEDVRLYNAMQGGASRYTFADVTHEPACLMVPVRAPGVIGLKRPFSVPVRLIFNRAQPAGRTYGILVLLQQEGGGDQRYVLPLPALILRNGQTEVTVQESFKEVDASFVPGPAMRDGRSAYFACLVYREGNAEPESLEDWHAVSAFCGWPLSR